MREDQNRTLNERGMKQSGGSYTSRPTGTTSHRWGHGMSGHASSISLHLGLSSQSKTLRQKGTTAVIAAEATLRHTKWHSSRGSQRSCSCRDKRRLIQSGSGDIEVGKLTRFLTSILTKWHVEEHSFSAKLQTKSYDAYAHMFEQCFFWCYSVQREHRQKMSH